MREAVGHDAARGLLLQAVISDGRGGLERLLKVARLENPALFHEIAPDAREAVGLKLHLDLKGVGLLLRHALLERLNLLGNAEHGLHMVPDLMGEHVSERKVAASAELLLHVVVKAQVKVDLPVGRTIEGPHRRLAVAAGGRGAARVEHELRVRIPFARGAEDLGPDVLRRLERNAGELRELLLGGRALVGRRSRRLRLDGEGLSRQQRREVDPVVARHEHHDHDGQPRLASKRNAAAGAKASRAAHAPAVLDRRAFLKILPAHEKTSLKHQTHSEL